MSAHLGARGLVGVTSSSFALNRMTTSPSTQRTSHFVTRNTTLAGRKPAGSAFVVKSVRVLEWIKSAAADGAGR